MSMTFDRLELIPDSKLRKLLGKSPRTIGRWDANPELGFPKPVTLNGRKHRRVAEVEAWLNARRLPPLAGASDAAPVIKTGSSGAFPKLKALTEPRT